MKVKLDEHQLKAVKHLEGPALVVAGPGSGKTTVIIERILNLIQEHNVNPSQILAIAFTNAAAYEMNDRIKNLLFDHREPKICTLHSFGKELITAHYELLGFRTEPETWDAKKISKIIRNEKRLLKEETQSVDVAIYKFEGRMTGRVYIGQSIDPFRREKEHRSKSSNKGLRDALEFGDEIFDFEPFEWVKGAANAFSREKYWIQHYKNKSAVNLVHQRMETVAKKSNDINVDIYKLKSLEDYPRAYFGYTTELNAIREKFNRERTSKIIFDEVLYIDIPWKEAYNYIEKEIRKHQNWAVFNREDPINARYRNQVLIEIFCEHFNVVYEEVLEKPENFENLYEKYDNIKNVDIDNAKRKVIKGLFNPEEIKDLVIRAFAKKYEKRKKEANGIDFLDMLILSAYLLENDQDLFSEYREKYRYVFVDEFQDISPVDFRLVDLFSENLFAVGDDDQAIYGFRGGDSSIMQERFGKRENVAHYEIARNYRSRSDIVLHSKALIENNECRISKDLRADNSKQAMIDFKDTPKGRLFSYLFKEISEIQTCDYQKVGILARNWKGEINKVHEMLNCSEIRSLGYEIEYKKISDSVDEDNNEDGKRQKMFLRKDSKEIEIINIYAAKGREWDKVFLLVNTLYNGLPRPGNNLAEERRIFYVAVTRAKHELVILDGGNCDFIDEFQELPHSERKRRLAKDSDHLFISFGKRLDIAKERLRQASEALPTVLKSHRERLIESSVKAIREQYKTELDHVRNVSNETNSITKKIKTSLPEQLKKARESFLPELIPVLDQLELVIKNVTETTQTETVSSEFTTFCEYIHSTQEQFLSILKNHGLNQIDTLARTVNPMQYEELQSRVFSNEVPKGKIVREILKGYILNGNIIRKAQVVVSKGEKQSDWFLNFDSTQSICFVTDHDIYFLWEIKVDSEIIRGFDFQGLAAKIQKQDVLFAFAKRNWDAIKPEQQNVKPISERISISDEFLRSILVKKGAAGLKFVIKAGYVLCGQLYSFDKEVLNIIINKKIVVLFRHGILAILDGLEIKHTLKIKSTQVEKPIHLVNESINGSKIHDWGKIMNAYANATPVNGEIIKHIQGGLRVRIGSLQGFLPTSQIDLRPIHKLDSYVGKTFEMKIIEFNQQQNNLVVSRRALLEEKRNEFLETVETGQIVSGIVKNITTFGAFVDLGEIEGLIHKTELVCKPTDHPSKVISVGDEIKVKVININREQNKISLSLKQMITNPWDDIENKYPVGSTVNGFVVNIVDYGAFIQLEEGIVGLLHVSEMLHDGIPMTNLLNVGDEVEVVVLEISKDSNRVSLGIKQTQENLLKALLQKYPNNP